MSVNAYLIKEINVKTKDEELIIEKILEKTPTFNLIHNKNILDILQKNKCDNLNADLNGEISINNIIWKNILKDLKLTNYSPEELKIIEKITLNLKNKEIIFFKCF